jgi:16S rRNA (cytosine967-C5)-methyltransferase
MKPARRVRVKPTTARSLALAVLLECREHTRFVQDILDRHLTAAPLPPADRRLATQLVYGVLRRRLTLDTLLRPLVTRPLHQVEPWVWEALRLGAYQLALLTHIPPHAVLHETVELASAVGRPGGKGFLNAVLRRLARLVTDERTDEPGPAALPLEAGVYRVLSQPVLPDPSAQPLEYLAAAFALPRWLVERWAQRFDRPELIRLGFWFAGPAPLWLRVNPLRATRPQLLAALAAAGIAAEPGAHPQAVRLSEHAPVRELPGYAEGWFTVQDESAMWVSSALAPRPGWCVLDLCAAPGGKATHLAELMRNEGRVVAADADANRLAALPALARRLGLTIIEPLALAPDADPPCGPFDGVLVDAPCSNTGVLGRRPEARWRLKPGDFTHLVPLQTKLLIHAAERVKPGGVIVYSTCSIEPEENRQIVANVRRAFPDLTLEQDDEQVPGRPADGGYWARLRRT